MSYLYVNETEICKFKAKDKTWYDFFLRSVSKNFTKDKKNEISLNGMKFTVYEIINDLGKYLFLHDNHA